jgi:hypothetical protein
MVKAAGVELSGVLTVRKLMILGSATTAKKAPLPDSLYFYLYENVFRSDDPRTQHSKHNDRD